MLIGVPKEIKNHEYRVGLTPASVQDIVSHGHQVIIEAHAGDKIGFSDDDYVNAGAAIVSQSQAVYGDADMIVKVKEPQPEECQQLREGQVLFAYLHLAPDPQQMELLLASKATCIAYETVTGADKGLPLLAPMSEVAGRLAVLEGAHHMTVMNGGKGILMSGVPGTPPAKVVIIGGGVVGYNAAIMAAGVNADVTLLDINVDRLRHLTEVFNGKVRCIYSTPAAIEEYCLQADMVVGAVLIPGAEAPKVLSRELISRMRQGTVLVDVAIDQGGCFETSRATTHEQPTYTVDGVVHYCVANIPGAVARTSTQALNNATLPFVRALANKGYRQALLDDAHLLDGLNVHRGHVTYPALINTLSQYEYIAPHVALGES